METKELGAGSYPEAPTNENKTYVAHCSCSIDIDITIYAENEEQAMELVMNGYYDDYNYGNYKIEEIKNIEEV